MHSLDVAANGLGGEGCRSVDPHADLGRTSAPHSVAETGGNLDRHPQFAAAHLPLQIGVVGERRRARK
jgi:hypothetical protein